MKKIIIFIAINIATAKLYAQVDPIRQKLDSIFQHINKNQVPSGYFKRIWCRDDAFALV